MLQWIQYIKGYVSIKVWGYSTERFLNLCGNHDILIWDIENHGDYYTMKVSVKGFFALKTLLRKTGTRAAVLKKYGLPFFAPKIKKRKIFVLGMLACLIFWLFTTRFIWDIKIEGNYTITDDMLLDYLETQGVHTAMKKSKLQIEELEMQLREHYDVITWTSLKLEGTSLIIKLRENETANYDYFGQSTQNAGIQADDGEACRDIVAAIDGVIVYMITRKGVPQAAVGDTVVKGQVLVCGAVPIYNEDTTIKGYQYYDSDADILIAYEKAFSVEKKTAYVEKEYSGEEKKLLLFGFRDREWNLSLGRIKFASYDVAGEKKQVKLLDHLFLPIFYGTKYAKEYALVPKKHTEEEMEQIINEEFEKILLTLDEKGVQITEKNVTIRKSEDKWIMDVRLKLTQEAVEKVRNETPEVPVTENGEME
ncbi:MAG: sporulation protein YqfD [Clostridiales bacterium]|nr:sporulation protein YqfD [Clostridiales bacterium]